MLHSTLPFALLTLATLASAQDPKTATIQLPESVELTDAIVADIDGDALPDLVLACRHTATGTRSLRMHSRRKRGTAFASTPTRKPFDLFGDAIAFTFCDCTDAPGQELILLTAERIVLVTTASDGAPDYRGIGRHALVWPAADPNRIVPLRNAAVDFDGDGREDLLLPRPDGWSVWFQDRQEGGPTFERHSDTTMPRWQNSLGKAVRGRGATGGDNQLELRIGRRRDEEDAPLVRIATRTPQCQAIDLDGDGKLDLVAQRNGRMHAAMQTAGGKLDTTSQALPLPKNRLKLLDPGFNVQWPDINGDGRRDLLLTTSAQRDGDVEARVDLFLAGPDGKWPDKPDSRLRMQAIARPPQVLDIDGDGKPEIACVTLRTSAMSAITNPTATSLDAQLTVYDFDGRKLVTPAMLTKPMPLATNSRLRKPFLMVRPGRRGRAGDVVMHKDGNVERRFLNGKNGSLRMAKSDAAAPTSEKSRIVVADELGDDILIVTGSEVRHVRFRR